MEHILVTGGLGFIGSNFILHMLEKYPECSIVNVDAMTYAANPENLKAIGNSGRYHLVVEDLSTEKGLIDLRFLTLTNFDYIVHFAAETHVDNSIKGPLLFSETNVQGTHNLLEAVRLNYFDHLKESYRLKKIVYISTDEVYGSLKPKQRSSKENDSLKPNSPYSASKAGGEHIARAYWKTFGLPLVITRSSNNYGPRQFPEKLMPLFVTNVLEGKKVPLMGDGSNIRDWIYVEDNCEGIDLVMRRGKVGEVYNIGGGNEKTNREITDMILSYLGKDDSWIQTIPHRLGHDFRYSLNCSKAEKLGWTPKTDFKEGMKKTIEWYIENQEWWKKLKGKKK